MGALAAGGFGCKLCRVDTLADDPLMAEIAAAAAGAIRVRADAGQAIVEVEDTGPGIAPAERAHVFERFYRIDKSRTKLSGGTGLGLSIVKHIVQAHGSKIQVESKVDKGTSFSFKLEKAI